MQRPSWLPGKTTDACRLSRSGMTFKPLTAQHGEAVLMSYLAAFPAKTSAQPERAQESTASAAACGHTWPESLAKFDHVSRSWKTRQCLLFEDSTECLETFPRWGMMRSGDVWARSTPSLIRDLDAQITNASESGFWQRWPTPRAGNPGSRPNGKGGKILAEEVKKSMRWPTPTVCGNHNRKGASATSGDGLATLVKRYPTPNASDADKWSHQSLEERIAKGQQVRLNTAAAPQGGLGGSLNPTWVEWLMGWPLGWTDCAASATDRFRTPWFSLGLRYVEGLKNDAKS
jgi:hypothetical protein